MCVCSNGISLKKRKKVLNISCWIRKSRSSWGRGWGREGRLGFRDIHGTNEDQQGIGGMGWEVRKRCSVEMQRHLLNEN